MFHGPISEVSRTIRNAVKAARIRAGLTPTDAATRSRVSRQSIYLIENEGLPSLRTAIKLAAAYGCSVSELIGEKKPQVSECKNALERRVVDAVLKALREA